MRKGREEGKHQGYTQVDNRHAIDPDTCTPKRELAWEQRLTVPPLDEHTRDTDDVRREQCTCPQRCHRVEGNRATNVDERKADGDDKGYDDAVERDVPPRSDVAKESTVRDTLISGKREELTRASGDIVDASENCHNSCDRCECSCA